MADGYIITPNRDSTSCGCDVADGGLGSRTYERIVEETGEKYLDLEDSAKTQASSCALPTKNKLKLRALR